MTVDDWRALVVELVSIDDAMVSGTQHVSNQGQALDGFSALAHFRDVAKRARVALAEPETKMPTVMEIIELADEIEEAELGQVDLVRAALARWGNPSGATPISVSDRSPKATDCDDEGCCWFGNKLSFTNKWEWFYGDAVIYMRSGCTHWLPASTKVLPTSYD